MQYEYGNWQDSMFSENWQLRFLRLSTHIAAWSKDPSTKVGAVIVRPDKTIATVGFNGFPRGIEDAPNLLNEREEKYKRVIHAELNAIIHAREPLTGYALYVSAPPCSHCVAAIIQSGVVEVGWVDPAPEFAERWADSMKTSSQLLKEAEITHYHADMFVLD